MEKDNESPSLTQKFDLYDKFRNDDESTIYNLFSDNKTNRKSRIIIREFRQKSKNSISWTYKRYGIEEHQAKHNEGLSKTIQESYDDVSFIIVSPEVLAILEETKNYKSVFENYKFTNVEKCGVVNNTINVYVDMFGPTSSVIIGSNNKHKNFDELMNNITILRVKNLYIC